MHISILLFWFIIISVAGIFFFAGYIFSGKLKNNDNENIMILGITDRDEKIKELENELSN